MPHFSPEQYTDLMSGYGDPDSIAALTEFQIDLNLRNLASAYELIKQETGGLTLGVRDTSVAIQKVYETSEQLGVEMLRAPSFGTLANLACKGNAWQACMSLAQLSGGVATAAFEAGLETTLQVLPKNGWLTLDRLGSLAVTTADLVSVTTGPDHLRVDDGVETQYIDRGSIELETSKWLPIRRLTIEANGLTIRPFIDDVFPYTSYDFPTGIRQTESQYKSWQVHLTNVWNEFVIDYPRHAEAIAIGLHTILPAGDVATGISTNSAVGTAFGTLQMSTPQNTFYFSANLLNAWLGSKITLLDLIYEFDNWGVDDTPLYAPTHDNPETSNRLLLDTYMNLGTMDFLDTHMRKAGDGADYKTHALRFARWYGMTSKTIETLTNQPTLREAGKQFVKEMGAQARSWQSKYESLPPDVRRAANITLTDHRIGWLLHNVRPNGAALERLRDYWESGLRCPHEDIPEVVIPSTDKLVHTGRRDRYILMGLYLSDPHDYDMRAADFSMHPEPHDLVPGNIPFAKGNFAEARRFYASYIQHHPESLEAWAGLAVTYSESREVAAKTFLTRPHVAAHLYGLLGNVQIDPIAVAEWLAA